MGRNAEPDVTTGRKSRVRSGWDDRVSATAWRRTDRYRVAQDADADPVRPEIKNANGMALLVVLVRRQTPTMAPLSTRVRSLAGGSQSASAQRKDAHVQVKTAP